MIYEICKKYCDLSNEDIEKVIEASKSLNIVSDFYGSDVFIDVLSKNSKEAIVVEHIRSGRNISLYKDSVIGKRALKENEPGVIKVLKTGIAMDDIKALTQENKFVKQKIRPIFNDEKVIGVIIVEIDISEEIKSDIELDEICEKSEIITPQFGTLLKNNRLISNNFDDAILIFDNDGILIVANDKAINFYRNIGYKEDINGLEYNKLSLSKDNFNEIIIESSGNKNIKEVNINYNYYKIITTIIEGQAISLIVVIKDVTDIRQKEIEIQLKDIAIKEANHRIKNNLQTIAAILRRQSRTCETTSEKITLTESINRILTIATTHDFLSKAIDDKIEIGKAIEKLVENIKNCSDTNVIKTYVEYEVITISGQKATAILLIVNELVQNCYDHAFDGRSFGEIRISIKKEDEYIMIEVSDNGIGFKSFGKKHNNLGLSLVENYTSQVLHGNITIDSDAGGSKIKIKFINE